MPLCEWEYTSDAKCISSERLVGVDLHNDVKPPVYIPVSECLLPVYIPVSEWIVTCVITCLYSLFDSQGILRAVLGLGYIVERMWMCVTLSMLSFELET